MNEYEVERGASFTGEKTRTQTLKHAETSQIKYDLIGKVAEGTTLTRKTVSAILQGIRADKLYMFKNNPEEFITKVIRLINEQKATMIGFGFYFDSRAHQFKAKPHAKSVAKFKKRMKEFTSRSWGVSNSYKVEKLNQLIRGWINYFEIGSIKTLCKELDARIRYRLRMCIWKQWKTPQNRIKNLMKLGVDKDIAWITAYTGSRIAYVCQRRVMNFAINKERLTQFGLVSMIDYYTKRCVTC